VKNGSSLIIRINYWAKWLKSAIIKSIKALRWYENESGTKMKKDISLDLKPFYPMDLLNITSVT